MNLGQYLCKNTAPYAQPACQAAPFETFTSRALQLALQLLQLGSGLPDKPYLRLPSHNSKGLPQAQKFKPLSAGVQQDGVLQEQEEHLKGETRITSHQAQHRLDGSALSGPPSLPWCQWGSATWPCCWWLLQQLLHHPEPEVGLLLLKSAVQYGDLDSIRLHQPDLQPQ